MHDDDGESPWPFITFTPLVMLHIFFTPTSHFTSNMASLMEHKNLIACLIIDFLSRCPKIVYAQKTFYQLLNCFPYINHVYGLLACISIKLSDMDGVKGAGGWEPEFSGLQASQLRSRSRGR